MACNATRCAGNLMPHGARAVGRRGRPAVAVAAAAPRDQPLERGRHRLDTTRHETSRHAMAVTLRANRSLERGRHRLTRRVMKRHGMSRPLLSVVEGGGSRAGALGSLVSCSVGQCSRARTCVTSTRAGWHTTLRDVARRGRASCSAEYVSSRRSSFGANCKGTYYNAMCGTL